MTLYFVPTRVANEYKAMNEKFDDLTMPVIKRKLTAMIWATKWKRELIDEENNIYQYDFNGIVIIVEEDNKCVQRIYLNPFTKDDGMSARNYNKICKSMGLNSKKNDFLSNSDLKGEKYE